MATGYLSDALFVAAVRWGRRSRTVVWFGDLFALGDGAKKGLLS